MEFKSRISYKFGITVIVTALAFVLVLYIFLSNRNWPGSGTSFDLLILLVIGIRLLYLCRNIDLLFSKKPTLIINDDFIYDGAKKMNFLRDEIEELYEDNGYLYLKLKCQVEGLEDDYELTKAHKINLEMVDIDDDMLAEIVYDFNKKEDIVEAKSETVNDISYRFKWGRRALWFIFQAFFWTIFPFLNSYRERHKDYYFIFFLLFAMSVLALPQIVRFLYFWITNKPILTANRTFIFDHFKNIKYYWSDIDEVVVNNAYMQIKLYHPEIYIDKVKNPIQRFFKNLRYNRFHKKPSYGINMDIVGVKAEDYNNFLNILNEFSLIAEG